MGKSIMPTPRGTCYACGNNMGYELHHIFGGTANRKKSEYYGLTVWLCPMCHRDSVTGVHGANLALKMALQTDAQATFERKYNHALFVQEFGKNYMEG